MKCVLGHWAVCQLMACQLFFLLLLMACQLIREGDLKKKKLREGDRLV